MSKQSKKLFDSLTDIREDFIEEAQEKPEKRKSTGVWPKWVAAAACFCLFAGTAFLLRAHLRPSPPKDMGYEGTQAEAGAPEAAEGAAEEITGAAGADGHRWPVKRNSANTGGSMSAAAEMAQEIPWEEKEIYDQYAMVSFDGRLYIAGGPLAVPTGKLTGELEEITAFSYEGGLAPEETGYTPAHQTAAVVSPIRGISKECAVAVRYEGTEEWYPALNQDYKPQTLGQFVQDLDLRENLVFGTAYYTYWPDGEHAQVHFDSVDNEKIWELLSNTEAENVCAELDSGQFHTLFDPEAGEPEVILDISVSIPVLGEENLSLQVREDGYLWTNLMGMTEKAFYLGEENTLPFVDYVLNECEGYETRFVSPESPQDKTGASSSAESRPASPPQTGGDGGAVPSAAGTG